MHYLLVYDMNEHSVNENFEMVVNSDEEVVRRERSWISVSELLYE